MRHQMKTDLSESAYCFMHVEVAGAVAMMQHDDRRSARILARMQEVHPLLYSDSQRCSFNMQQPGSPNSRSASFSGRYSHNSSGGGASPSSSSSDGGSDVGPSSPRSSSSSDGGSKSSARRRLLNVLMSPRRSAGQRSSITTPMGLEVAPPLLMTSYSTGPGSPMSMSTGCSIAQAGSSMSSGGSVLEVIKEDVLQSIKEDSPLEVPLE